MLDFRRAEVAQVVEQRTENPRVNSSTLFLGTTSSLCPASALQPPSLVRIPLVAGS